MRNRKWLHVCMVLVLLLSLTSPIASGKTRAETGLSQVSLTETENGITLSWEAAISQNEEIINYHLSKNGQTIEIEPAQNESEDGSVKQYSYEDTELEANTLYTYELTAITSSGDQLTSGKMEHTFKPTTEEEVVSEPTVTELELPKVAPKETVAADEVVMTNIKVSTTKGNIPWEFEYSIKGVTENVADVEYYGYLDDEGYFVDYEYETRNLELPVGTYELVTFNYSTEEEITAEFKVESDRDYLLNPIEISLDDDQLVIKKVLSVEGVTEQSISIFWDEPWEPEQIEKYEVSLDDSVVEVITDPYETTYTYTDLSQETTYQLKVDIFYKDGTVEPITEKATTTAPPVGEPITFADNNLKEAVKEALKIYHRDSIYVEDMERLVHLDANYYGIQSLAGLEYATNLTDLMVSGNEIQDLTPIENLENLVYLDLDSNLISKIESLKTIQSLEMLFISYNELTDISALLELPNLTHVSLYGNDGLSLTKGSADMNVIKALQAKGISVEWSDIQHELFITDVTENSVTFDMNFYEITDHIQTYNVYVDGELVGSTPASKPSYKLTGLDPLSEVYIAVEGVDEEGFIWGSAYTSVQTPPAPSGQVVTFADPALEEVIKETLQITSREIVESDLTIVTSLDASYRGISDLTGLEFAKNLEDLNLMSNSITDLTPLKGLTNLLYLVAQNNEIEDISPLKDVTKLEYLGLDGNQIEDISVLAGFTNLKYLTIQRNKIKDISALSNLNIEFLDISYNEISYISSLLTLPNLMIVMLMENALDLSEESDALAIIKELEEKEVVVVYEYLDITVGDVTDAEIELSWKPVTTDGFEDFSYIIFVNGEEVEVDTKDTKYLLTDLESETEYTIEIYGFVENDEERFIYGTTMVSTTSTEEPGDDTGDEEGETPEEEQPADETDEVTPPGKDSDKGSDSKDTTDKDTDKKNDEKKNNGKKLPTTATNSYNLLLFGLLFVGAGTLFIIATRRKLFTR
ncbi:leucine-rich repeat domain-containing protein [Ferdinandcohnia sp. Marseille-Q9671]